MGITKKTREEIYNKFGGLCAYSGTPLEPDWQVDHVVPIAMLNYLRLDTNDINNMIPCQKIINHYKRKLSLTNFRVHWLGGLHVRLAKLPKNPKAARSIKRKAYLLKVSSYFGITPDTPFSGVFYFEKFNGQKECYGNGH